MKPPKIYKTRSGTPYLPNGKTRFNLRDVSGVYVIYYKYDIAYIGSGGNCYKTFYHHFQGWKRDKQYRVIFEKDDTNVRARIIYTKTRQDALLIEKALLKKYPTLYNENETESEITKDDRKVINYVTGEETKPIITEETSDDLPF